MKDHELKVKHKVAECEMIISKKLYAENPGKYEVLEGEAPKVEKKTFEAPPAAPVPDVGKGMEVKNGASVKKTTAAKKAPASEK